MEEKWRADWDRLYRKGADALNADMPEMAVEIFEAIPVMEMSDRDGVRLALIGKAAAAVDRQHRDSNARRKAEENLRHALALTDNPDARRIARTELAGLLMLPKPGGELPNANERLEAQEQLETLLREQPDTRDREGIERRLASIKRIHDSPLSRAAELLAIEESFLNDELAADPEILDNQ
jgi:hypothetical protein